MRILPETPWADRLIAFKKFVKRHKRLRSKAMTMNDEYYRIKTSDMIRDPLRVFVSDKEYVKLYVRAVVGEQYNVPTLGVIRRVEDVDGYDFPQDCCVKPTHASGVVQFRRDGSDLDLAEIKSWFQLNHYKNGREVNYRYLQPKVIIEPIIAPQSIPLDYKIFCYDGVAKMIMVDTDIQGDNRRAFFDIAWNELGFSTIYPKAIVVPDRPDHLEHMLQVATVLSERFQSLIRVDLYDLDGDIRVGEITNISGNAQANFIPPSGEHQAAKLLFG